MAPPPAAGARPRVLATRRFAPPVRDRLARAFDLDEHAEDEVMPRAALLARAEGRDGLMVTPGDRVDAELLDRAGPGLRVVATLSVGLDHVDLAAARARGVAVAYTPDVLTAATAELAIAMTLALLRRVAEGDRLIRARRPWRLAPEFMLGHSVAGRVFGCVGYGRIGREAARMAAALGMRAVHTGRRDTGEPGWLPFPDLLARADVVSLHCPLTPGTRHLIDAAALARMRPEAVLVNTARGPVVDEAALVDALRAGRIAGAALDVFEHEPEVHEGLLGLENVVLVPHLGSATVEARTAMGMLCADALEDVLVTGRRPANLAPGSG